jgi:multiple sugar transport system substrate-binding protein
VQFLVDLIQKYKVSPTVQQMTDTDAMTMFESGKSAMYFTGSWEASAFKAVPYLLQNANVAPLPTDVKFGTVSNSLKNVIFSGTKHPAEAWKFVKFLGSKKAAELQAEGGVVIPAMKGTAAAWVKSIPQFNLQIFVDELAKATPYPTSLNSAVWGDFAQKEFTKAFTGTESVPVAAKKVANEMNKALAAEHK